MMHMLQQALKEETFISSGLKCHHSLVYVASSRSVKFFFCLLLAFYRILNIINQFFVLKSETKLKV